MNATAQLNNYRQSPRKVRLVADLVRGKKVSAALAHLAVLPKRAAGPLEKLIRSAAANARTRGLDEKSLVISRISVDKGTMLKRRTPRARGSAALIRKRNSHVRVELSQVQPSKKAASNASRS